MTTFIFPPGEKVAGPRKRGVYCTVLADIARSAVDAKDALNVFASLLRGDENYGFSRFDAHVGETGCHLRATMLMDVFYSCRTFHPGLETKEIVPLWIGKTIAKLEILRMNAQTTCLELSMNRKDPRQLGLNFKRETPGQIMQVLLSGKDIGTRYTSQQDYRSNWSAVPLGNPDGINMAKWKLASPEVLARFLVYSYTLSKYKRFFVGKNGGGCRLQFHSVAEATDALIRPYWDTNNKEYTEAKTSRIQGELTALQVWLSELSCEWLRVLARKLSADSIRSSVLCSSICSSSKGIAAAAAFPTFLLLREAWAASARPIMLVDRHFCSRGWHFNVLECKLDSQVGQNGAELFKAVAWRVQAVDIQVLKDADYDFMPVIVIMGNSINGNNEDYIDRVRGQERGSSSSRPHKDKNCAENSKHLLELLSVNHDYLSMAFFAAHEAYSFPYKDIQSESAVISSIVEDASLPRGAAAFSGLWHKLRSEADNLGVGKGQLSVIGWQHIFSESRYGLAILLEKWLTDENLMILSVK